MDLRVDHRSSLSHPMRIENEGPQGLFVRYSMRAHGRRRQSRSRCVFVLPRLLVDIIEIFFGTFLEKKKRGTQSRSHTLTFCPRNRSFLSGVWIVWIFCAARRSVVLIPMQHSSRRAIELLRLPIPTSVLIRDQSHGQVCLIPLQCWGSCLSRRRLRQIRGGTGVGDGASGAAGSESHAILRISTSDLA